MQGASDDARRQRPSPADKAPGHSCPPKQTLTRPGPRTPPIRWKNYWPEPSPFFANHGDDVHAVGLLDPVVPGHVGCIVIRPDGSRYLARAVPDPLAHHKPD
jgi:hypothetical protein